MLTSCCWHREPSDIFLESESQSPPNANYMLPNFELLSLKMKKHTLSRRTKLLCDQHKDEDEEEEEESPSWSL